MGLGIKTFLSYKAHEILGKGGRPFEGHYMEWRSRRIMAVLDQYGHRFFTGKTVLEVGAGYGDIGAFFSTLGAQVTCVEGRAANVRAIRKRYPFLEVRQHDLAVGWPEAARMFDVCIHFGVLYHLPDPAPALRDACRSCKHLILETLVCDSDDPNLVMSASEHSYIHDQSLHGVGCRPSPAFIERILEEGGFSFSRITDSRCNAGFHTYDWPITNSRTFGNGMRSMWFAEKK